MKKYVIFSDSTADLPADYIKEHEIVNIPLYYNMDGVLYGGDTDLSVKDFYDRMRGGEMPTTTASNPAYISSKYKEYIAKGYDILHISFSSALSGSCNNAFVTAREVSDSNPEAKIIVIDSLAASLGEGLMVYKAVELKEKGKTIDEVAKFLEDNKLHFCHQFTVEDLNHLYRGGRVSKATAVLGTMINIKPILHVDDEGRLVPIGKVRGRKKSLVTLVDNMEKTMKGYDNDVVMISHGDSIEDANYVASLIKERFGIENIIINPVSPTIGTHSGPGTIALFFMGETR